MGYGWNKSGCDFIIIEAGGGYEEGLLHLSLFLTFWCFHRMDKRGEGKNTIIEDNITNSSQELDWIGWDRYCDSFTFLNAWKLCYNLKWQKKITSIKECLLWPLLNFSTTRVNEVTSVVISTVITDVNLQAVRSREAGLRVIALRGPPLLQPLFWFCVLPTRALQGV